jgi:tRNA A37 threonylcarbamoyladenosine dehydratase
MEDFKVQNAFSRMKLLFGSKALKTLENSRVAIFGVGGVGSFVAEGLARSAVGSFILVDNDCVDITNINRQIHATTKTVGRPKVELMKERILDINPEAKIETHQLFYLPENSDGVLDGKIDYIVDAVDTVTAKIFLVTRAKELGIPIISSMGFGNKIDPTRIEVADISKTSVDPLARVVRKELRSRGIESLKVVYSQEEPLKPFEGAQGTRLPGSVSFVPSVAGLVIAGEVVKDIIKL